MKLISPNRRTKAGADRPLLVSFSGIDGAGKTTQIESLSASLDDAGLSVRVIRFWDDVAVLRRLREGLGHTLFKGEKGVGAPGKPVRRRDKNVQSWYMVPLRFALCFLDAVGLALIAARIRRTHEADVVIFDRYLYDQLTNLELSNPKARAYVRLLLKLVPRPDVANLLDADPALARERKPEYPLEFLEKNRSAYLAISRIAGMHAIPPGTPEEVGLNIRYELAKKLARVHGRRALQALTST